jgi:predicted DNA-binding protein
MPRPKKLASGHKIRQSPMRLDEDLHSAVSALSEKIGESKATITRQALRIGLQELSKRLCLDH